MQIGHLLFFCLLVLSLSQLVPVIRKDCISDERQVGCSAIAAVGAAAESDDIGESVFDRLDTEDQPQMLVDVYSRAATGSKRSDRNDRGDSAPIAALDIDAAIGALCTL